MVPYSPKSCHLRPGVSVCAPVCQLPDPPLGRNLAHGLAAGQEGGALDQPFACTRLGLNQHLPLRPFSSRLNFGDSYEWPTREGDSRSTTD